MKSPNEQFENWTRDNMALKVTQIRSAIGTKPKQRGTLRALGLGKIGKTHILPDKPEIRGMINTVPHLIEVEEVS
ncbi:MAG: 50S ribosomal protein L30 [Acidimicrobiaceae bacterium TMED130]|nr:MAG: 50S ribosomal protein L30 [Acidimicrobiaceae bacterium TMED130]